MNTLFILFLTQKIMRPGTFFRKLILKDKSLGNHALGSLDLTAEKKSYFLDLVQECYNLSLLLMGGYS